MDETKKEANIKELYAAVAAITKYIARADAQTSEKGKDDNNGYQS